MKKVAFHVISHTHWDREWYLPFETFRVELVELIDNLLDILEQNNDFIFHLDGYTLLIDDYLEIRPGKKELIKKYIKSENVLTGPWYVLSDQFLTSGEATIRNLFIGIKNAKSLGNAMMVGYLPDQFGQIAQLPQILKGFGISSAILGRGIQDGQAEYTWHALNDDAVLAILLTHWYNNAQRLPTQKKEFITYVNKIYDNQSATTKSGEVLLMNGCDHLFPQPEVSTILKSTDNNKPWSIQQSRLPEVIQLITNKVRLDDLPKRKGELRDDNNKFILASTLSSRVYLKLANYKIQTLLEKIIEPLSVFLGLNNITEYPYDELHYAWKALIKNHAHDSICGCSIDEVHREMEVRFEKTLQLLKKLQRNLLLKLSTSTGDKNQLQLFNFTNAERNETFEVEIEFPLNNLVKSTVIKEIQITHNKEEINFEIIESYKLYKMVSSRHEIPSLQIVQVIKLLLKHKLKPFSVITLDIKTNLGGKKITLQKEIKTNKPNISYTQKSIKSNLEFENDGYSLKIHKNGTLNINLKNSKYEFKNLHFFTTEIDNGDLYRFIPNKKDKTIICCDWDIKVIEENKFRKIFALHLNEPEITTLITCYKDLNRIDFTTKINNKLKNKRVRLHFPTALNTNHIYADTPFGTLERKRPPKEWLDPAFVQPLYNWIDHNNHKYGLAFFGGGIAEYELYEDGNGFAITLVRSVGKLSIVQSHSLIETPEAQCLREVEFSYAIYPHLGTWVKGNVHNEQLTHQSPILINQSNQKFNQAPMIQYTDKLLLSTLKISEEKDNLYILRLFNPTSEKLINSKISLSIKPKKIYLLNLNEEIIEKVAEAKHEFTCTVDPYQILTFGLER